MRSESYVVDAATGAVLEGLPSLGLFLLSEDMPAYRATDGEWCVTDTPDSDRDDGYEVRIVRVVTRREIVRDLIACVCGLREAADERAAARRKTSADLEMAREQLREFYADHSVSRGWSREVLLTARILRNNVERLQAACGVEP